MLFERELNSSCSFTKQEISRIFERFFCLKISIFYSLESVIDYLKQNADHQYFCDADIVVRNRSDFDPKTVCSENSFLPIINSTEHIRHLSLILQSLDLEQFKLN